MLTALHPATVASCVVVATPRSLQTALNPAAAPPVPLRRAASSSTANPPTAAIADDTSIKTPYASNRCPSAPAPTDSVSASRSALIAHPRPKQRR